MTLADAPSSMIPQDIEFNAGKYLVVITFDEDEAHGRWSAFITVVHRGQRVASASWAWYRAGGQFSQYEKEIPGDIEDRIRAMIMIRESEIEEKEEGR